MSKGFFYSDWNKGTDTTAEPAYFREIEYSHETAEPTNKNIDVNKPIRFMDYDGSIVASYTPEEFAELTSFPTNPSHDGLIGQGWNWTLTDAKEYVASYGTLNIGQMYTTSDGKTKIYVSLPENAVSPYLELYLNDNTTVIIDWGDGTTSTWNAITEGFRNEQHIYANPGDYVISIDVTVGSIEIKSSSSSRSMLLSDNNNSSVSVYQTSVKKIEIGDGVTSIGQYAFGSCYALQSVVIPSSVISISHYAFRSCYSLQSVVIPSGVTWIGDNTFSNCYALQSVVIPSNVTSIGNNAFNNCNALQSVVIPSGVTSIGKFTFSNCYALQSVAIPSGVTSMDDNAFSNCYALQSVVIPSNVTSIGYNAFSGCISLQSVVILSSVTLIIGNYAFSDCISLVIIKFECSNPPTLRFPKVFEGLKTYAKILVPAGTLSAYTSAANYPDPNTYTYEEY